MGQYVITSQMLKNGTSMHQSKISTFGDGTAGGEEQFEYPIISGATWRASSTEPEIQRSVVKTGYAFFATCKPAAAPDVGKIECLLQGHVTDLENPQMVSPETQDAIEKAIKKGYLTLALPTVDTHYWSQSVVLRDGEQAVLKMEPYELKVTVQKH
ncbi:hypothetical protein BAU07_26515 (plasmid) [Bordetella flabilis]|uniref:Uncharacterized protein n=2 Tax=Bordetella flabilis TaxID=463014 RepID=A0A193GLA7_9BORD|nr:hypothetical protein BAU07_26515 [Bordetella flabilis]